MKIVFVNLYHDNTPALDMAHNPIQHNKTKYIDIGRHFERLKSGR